MRLFSRYVLKETAFPFGVALVLISFMLIMNKLLTLADLVIKHGVGLSAVFRLILYILPSTFAVTIPMSLLVAVMVALGRLSTDMELVAIKAASLSLTVLFRPLLLLGLAVSLGMLAFNELALPQANQSYKILFYDIVSQRSSVAIQENTWVGDFEGMVLHVGSKERHGDRLDDLTIIKLKKDKEPLQWIQSRWGRLVSDKENFRVFLELHEGSVQFMGGEGYGQLISLDFRQSRVDLDISGTLKQVQGDDSNRQPQEMTIREIWKDLGAMPGADPRKSHFGVEMHKKIAIPFACLAFILVGFPLGILVRKGGRMVGFMVAIGLIFVYYLLLSLGQTYGDEGRLRPWMSMWLPNAALFGCGVPLAWASLREKLAFSLSLR